MEISDTTVLVTGADRGVGAALTACLLERGCRVFAGRFLLDEPELSDLVPHFPERLVTVPLDVSREESVAAAASVVGARAAALDILFNVAGILGDIQTTVPGSIDFPEALAVYNTNALGPLRVANAFFGLLQAGATRLIVNVSSEAGSIGACRRDGWYGYCMSKAAQNMTSALLHNRLRPFGGFVIAMHPGGVKTKMRGTRIDSGEITSRQSAEGIIHVVQNALAGGPGFRGDRPAFVDYAGAALPW